jgi:thiazole/oxazole-forming peptide maturase SagC family component
VEKLGNAIRGLDAVIVCADSASPALMDVVNEAALRTNKRLLVGQVAQGVGLVGPTVIPKESACYKCYELRRNANLLNYEEIMKYESRLREMPGIRSEMVAPRPFAALIGGLLALEALRLLSGIAPPQTVGRILRINFNAPEMTYHRLLRLPNCPACGYEKRRPLPQLPSGK